MAGNGTSACRVALLMLVWAWSEGLRRLVVNACIPACLALALRLSKHPIPGQLGARSCHKYTGKQAGSPLPPAQGVRGSSP